MKQNFGTKITEFFINYFSFSGQLVSQAEAEAAIREGVSFKGTNIVILILAIFIASLGLNTNSTAVIIGAMLISPLMGPIIGIGLGVGIHDFALLKRCLRNLLMAAGFSVITSTLYFLISPVNEQHSELLARTSPTIYDVLIGFVGGGAGIVALGSTNKGNVIPGVAIATALMPPLCTAGYGLATWQMDYFLGALYLFVINSIYIAFATFVGVKFMKYKGVNDADDVRARRVRHIVYSLAILTMLPSIYLTYNMLTQSRFQASADRFIAEECNFPDTQVLNRKIFTENGERCLQLTMIGHTLPVDSLQLALSAKLKYYGLQGTKLIFIQGGDSPLANVQNTSADDIFRLTQNTISRQQSTIDSLRAVIARDATSQKLSVTISPELRVIFPTIQQIGIANAVFVAPADTLDADTTAVAMIKTSAPLPKADHDKLVKYLEARLGAKQIMVVNI